MKNLTNKRGFFAVAAALLVLTAMLVTKGCSNDINSGEFIPPEGKGAVRLSFNDNVTRTIMPGATTVDIGDFELFKFIFEPDGSGTRLEHPVYTGGGDNLNAPIVLDPGQYDLTVIGYIANVPTPDPTDSGDWDAVASNVNPVSVTILAGKIANAKVELRLLTDGVETGEFKYTLFNNLHSTSVPSNPWLDPDDILSAHMKFTPISAGGSSGIDVDISGQFDNTQRSLITIKTGIYYVEFEIEVESETVSFMHIVHIYKDFPCEYEFKIGLNYFNAVYKSGSTDINFDDTDKNPVIEYSITGGSPYTDAPIYPASIPAITKGTVITFKIKDTTGYTANRFEWFCLGNSALVNTAYCTINPDTTTCTIDTTLNAANPFSSARDYNLTVVGVVDGVKYATVVKFSVTP